MSGGGLLGAGTTAAAAGATLTVDTFASAQTFDSGPPRVRDDDEKRGRMGGKGFAAIARIVNDPSGGLMRKASLGGVAVGQHEQRAGEGAWWW